MDEAGCFEAAEHLLVHPDLVAQVCDLHAVEELLRPELTTHAQESVPL